MARKRKSPPKHGPVRKVTDPDELARIAEKHCANGLSIGLVPCTGKVITVWVGKQQRDVTDHYVAQLLEEDAARPAEQRLKPKQRSALVSFRRRLSEKGAEAFSIRQKSYLGELIKMVENPQKRTITKEEKEKRNRQIEAFYAFLRDKDKDRVNAQIIVDFFSPELLRSIVSEVSGILRPYGLESEAAAFISQCGYGGMNTYINHVKLECPFPKEWPRFLFSRFLDPNWVFNYEFFFDISEIPEKLRKELKGVPPEATEVVKDKMNSVVFEAEGKTSISDIAAGAPGSGKGGSPVK